MKQNMLSQRTKHLTLSAMLTALSVVVLYLGTLLDVLTLTAAGIASLFVWFAKRELPRVFAVSVYVATSFLSLLLLPNPEAGVVYLFFGGLYPLLKNAMERHRRPLPLVLKLVYVNLTVLAVEAISFFLLSVPFEGWLLFAALFVIANPTFFLYDLLLDRLLIWYEVRLRPRIARFL